jgi:hypothetical protein
VNEKNGIEFTYMTWLFIDGWESQNDNWKHLFHKGPAFRQKIDGDVEPHQKVQVQGPGVWLHPYKNSLRIYMNTFESAESFVDIHNLPVSKWFHVAIVLSHRTLDVYINGLLKESIVLRGVPKQNYYNLHIAEAGGFNGFLSNFQYLNYAIKMFSLNSIIAKGPNNKILEIHDSSADKIELPYLDSAWWID